MSPQALLAVDWGTSNLRAWVLDEAGAVLRGESFPYGVAKLPAGDARRVLQQQLRPALEAQALPAILCGMVGSNLGIVAVPYVDCPVDAAALASKLHRLDGDGPPSFIVPGLRCIRPSGDPDVMRGEETKILGWLAQDPVRRRGRRTLVMVGTHPKWVTIEDGRVIGFLTAMSGELFDVLSSHGVLRSDASPDHADAFDEGLAAGDQQEALASRLFAVRSRVVGGDMPADEARAYLSGLLIGDEVAHMTRTLGLLDAGPVALLGDERLCERYARALGRCGVKAEADPGDEAVLAGLLILQSHGAG